MKTLKLIAAGIILLVSSTSNAQLSISLNIGAAPVYRNAVAVDYYYLPDIQTYYDVRANQYVYFERGNWKRSKNLPVQYKHYDARNGYRVALNDYHGNQPYKNFNSDKKKYYNGYRADSKKTVINRSSNATVIVNNKNAKDTRYASNDRNQSNKNYRR